MGCVACAGFVLAGEMGGVTLRLEEPIELPTDADYISPDHFLGLDEAEIAALPLYYGGRELTIGEFFTVEGTGEEIVIEGDLSHVKRIGQGMTRGRIVIHGDVGMYLGAEMRGGGIVVHGDAAAWAGVQMAGGHIHIKGNAGPMLGGAYPGEKRGMRGGVIVVEGNAGWRVGEQMRRGVIAVQGDVGEFAGARMIAGSIFVFGRLGARAGARMKRGTIVALGDDEVELLPTFCYQCSYRPSFLRLYLRQLQEWGLPVKPEHVESRFRRYSGDITELGKGEILVLEGE